MDRYDKTIDEIRKFNRFYTVNMGLLDLGYLGTDYSAAETRILFEIQMQEKCIQSDIAKSLHIDKSYLSRMLKRLYKNGIIEKDKSGEDKRATYITLTEKGSAETEKLIHITNHHMKTKISGLSSGECEQLRDALDTVISILGKEEKII